MLLNSQVSGSGNHVLIVLHGFLGMLDNWKSFAKRMDQNKYQIHLVDQRNHGKSFHNNLFNYEILATDLKNYIDHYKIKKFSLIGHSMGGKTAMMFSSMYPELIKKLIIVDILPIYYSNDYNKIIDSLKSLDLKKLVSRVNIDKALESEFKEPAFRAFLLKNLYRVNKDELAFKIDLDIISNNLSEVEKSLPPNLHYNGKTLFIKGQKSDYINKTNSSLLKKVFPDHKIVEVQKAGHWVHAENLDGFINETELFLES